MTEIYSLIFAVTMAAAAGLVGAFALMRRMTLAADAISHIALPGLGLALLFKINPLIGGAATLFLGAILIWHLEQKTGINTEAITGVIFAASIAFGALITPSEDLIEALFGGFPNLSPATFIVGLLASLAIILAVFKFKEHLLLATFSPDLAQASGLKLRKINLFFLLIFALAVILGLSSLGALLMGSLIIIPAVTARQFADRFSHFLLTAAGLSVVSVIGGVIVANYFSLETGPAIVVLATVFFFISLLRRR